MQTKICVRLQPRKQNKIKTLEKNKVKDNHILKNHKIVFIGNSAVGKSSIINQYIYESANSEHQPTVWMDFFAKMIKAGDQQVRIQIWDTAGQEKFNSLIPSYIRDSTVVVFVFDITSRRSFDSLEKWAKMVNETANPKIIVVGNKCDLEEMREVSAEEGTRYAEQKDSKYIETSAIKPSNITELFTMLAAIPVEAPETDIKAENEAKGETNPNQKDAKAIDLTKQNQQNNGAGCSC